MSLNVKENTIVLGVMSGTSLDGLDLALCSFSVIDKKYAFEILKAETINYSLSLKVQLSEIQNKSAESYFLFHAQYGAFIADEINRFLKDVKEKPTAIASHGHTVFHRPELGFTTQVGCGATIAAKTGITSICDFRSLDLALKGQGAPLVPIGDRLLFGEYDACLNIGGIANISFEKNGQTSAYDICVANMLLNYLAGKLNKAYDEGGNFARNGKVDKEFLHTLNNLEFYSRAGAKSLGREWFETNVLSILPAHLSVEDLLATSTEHMAIQIGNVLTKNSLRNVCLSGGGAFNTFLVERIKTHTTCEIIIPSSEIINYKEALIFAFLGCLRLHKKINTLKTVTGATVDSIGGAVYLM